jgi:Family of unknown function (DUF6262)
MAPDTRKTRGILAHAQQKAQAARQRVNQAIEFLVSSGQAVNFNAVAKQAGVTKSYLYVHMDIREWIEALRQQQSSIMRRKRRTETSLSRTDKSKDILLAAKDRRIRELEEQNRKLREELKVVYGKWYEQM